MERPFESIAGPIRNRKSCESAIRTVVGLSTINAIVIAIYGAIYVLRTGPKPEQGLAALLDLWPLALSGLFAVLAYQLYRYKSRVASTATFLIHIVLFLQFIVLGGSTPLPHAFLQTVFIFVYARGMYATYLWHSNYRHRPECDDIAIDDPQASGSGDHQWTRDIHQRSSKPPNDLCPKCFEYFDEHESQCKYCGALLDVRARTPR